MYENSTVFTNRVREHCREHGFNGWLCQDAVDDNRVVMEVYDCCCNHSIMETCKNVVDEISLNGEMLMKILELSSYYSPEQISSSHLTNDLYQALVVAGFSIEEYVPMPTRGISDEVRKQFCKRKYEELKNGQIVVHRFSMFREGKNPIQRAIRYILVNIVQYIKGTTARNVDIIYAASTPPTQGLLCGLVKRRLSKRYGRKIPFIYCLQDVFPDSLVNAKMTKKGSIIWKIGRKIEDYTYRSADKIIVISESFKKNIMKKGVPEEKIVVIPNWVDTDVVYPVDRKDNILFDRYNLDRDKFYICYSGNLGHSQNLKLLLETAKQLKSELTDVCFVLVGEGAAKEELIKKVAEEQLENIIILPFQPYEDIAHVFSLGDVGLIISKPEIGGSSVPSKTWSIMAAGRPVLASFDEDSELFRLIEGVGCGVCVQADDDTESFKKAIYELYENKEKNAKIGVLGRNYLMDYLGKDKCVGMYIETIRNEK